jgi:hypothetical protein
MNPFFYSLFLTALLASSLPANKAMAEQPVSPIKATTANGDQVLLHPNGHWEFIDVKKAAEAKEVAKQFPENQSCPSGTQGGLLGFGRCIPVGDRDYNRGSMSGKGR